MWLKGIVMKIKENYAIVLTQDNEFTRIKLKNKLAVGQKIIFTSDDILAKQNRWADIKIMPRLAAAVAVFLLIAGGIIGYNNLLTDRGTQGILHNVVAFVTVDINPSIQISVDADNKTIAVESLNEDGSNLSLAKLIGLDIDEAIEVFVASARKAGFLDVKDLTDDFVLITTIPLKEDAKAEAGAIEAKIKDKISESTELQNVNVAMIEATVAELAEAQQHSVPAGLVAASGGVVLGDEIRSVQEFFADEERLAAFNDDGEIIEKTFENQAALIEKYLNQMETEGVRVENTKASFQQARKDFIEAKRLFHLARDEYHQALKSGDQSAIAAARIALENAEKHKEDMEEHKDNLESIKEKVKQHIEGDNYLVDDDEDDEDDSEERGNVNKEKQNNQGQSKQQNRQQNKDSDEDISDDDEDNEHDDIDDDDDNDEDEGDEDEGDDDNDADQDNDDNQGENDEDDSSASDSIEDADQDDDEDDQDGEDKKNPKDHKDDDEDEDSDQDNSNEDNEDDDSDEDEDDDEDDDDEDDDEDDEDDDDDGNKGKGKGKKTD